MGVIVFSLERTVVELRKLVKEGVIDVDEFAKKTREYMSYLNDIVALLNRLRV